MSCKMAAVTRGALFEALRDAWAADTSVDPRWSDVCRSRGQCAVTALVVQDYLGGHLMRAVVEGVSHYWNRLPEDDIDLTRDQFGAFAPVNVTERSRKYVLSFPDTATRYELFRRRVATILAGGSDNATDGTNE